MEDETGGDEASPPPPGRKPQPGVQPGLHVVATPIGNLEDLTRRAERVLATADLVLCEDTRVTGNLLHRLGLHRPLMAYHEHNAARVRPLVLERLRAGEVVALVSDAGTPLVSDPGFKLVREAALAGFAVVPVPGPSAVLAALAAAALPTDRFLFAGFLPAKPGARARALDELGRVRATLVLFESAQRLPALLAEAAERLGPRPAAVARELTKLYEEVRRDRLDALAAHYAAAGPPRGEVVVVIGPADDASTPELDDEAVEAALREALATQKPRAAAAAVAEATGLPANELYRRALALREPR
jgi:16S rRNA (cytidine1402-2'-O)-methyltransferase